MVDFCTSVFVLVFLGVGGLLLLKPDAFLKFQIWQAKKLMGMKMVPTKKTILIYRFMGVLFAIFALLALFGLLPVRCNF